MKSYTKLLTESALIKDFGHFQKKDWLMFSHYDDEILELLMRDRHKIQVEWTTTQKFSLVMLKISFRYEIDSACDIIEASQSYSLEGNKMLETTQIHLPECLIDRSFYNNKVYLDITEEEFAIVELYKKIFKTTCEDHRERRFNHYVVKYTFLEIDRNEQVDYFINYSYYDTMDINSVMGVKKFYHAVASTGEDDFKIKLVKMLEKQYTIPLLNKSLLELNDDDILVLNMNNT
jgi:hypothetical protein